MKLVKPLIVTPRLLVGVSLEEESMPRIGRYATRKSFISVNRDPALSRYLIDVDTPSWHYRESNIRFAVCGSNTMQDGLESFLAFVLDAAGRYRHTMRISKRTSQRMYGFPEKVVLWAYHNSDELATLHYELSEAKAQAA